ncbi:hypothetical protein ENBRE01_1090 [Enteropsectra breve]|nr:hypothetical protein ENBRE01_1090 [Enteropsectra breve]
MHCTLIFQELIFICAVYKFSFIFCVLKFYTATLAMSSSSMDDLNGYESKKYTKERSGHNEENAWGQPSYKDTSDEASGQYLEGLTEIERERELYRRESAKRDEEEKRELGEIEVFEEEIRRPRVEECNFVFRRNDFIEHRFKPTIKALKNCWVLAKFGHIYDIARVVGFGQEAPYSVPGCSEKMMLNLNLERRTKISKACNIINISGRMPEEVVWNKWVAEWDIVSVDKFREDAKRARAELNRDLTYEEIDEVVQSRFKANPKKISVAQQKINLICARDSAIQERNQSKARYYQKKLENLEDEILAEKTRRMKEDNEGMNNKIKNQRN